MNLRAMQPYFLPYLGYIEHINICDKWIVFDTPQFLKQSWMCRNRITSPCKDWEYINIPVRKHKRSASINQIIINHDIKWRENIFNKFRKFKNKANFYDETVELLKTCFEFETDYLSEMNIHCLRVICDFLNIEFNPIILSQDKLFQENNINVKTPGEWGLKLCKLYGANCFINPKGGEKIIINQLFKDHNIKLILRDVDPIVYKPYSYTFVTRLSVIDTILWVGREKVLEYLDMNKSQ